MKQFEEYKKQQQKEIAALGEQIESVMNQLAGYIDEMYENGGMEAFGKLYYPEYYGVASINVPSPDGDSSSYYYFPEGFSEEHEGWISSSQTC